MPLVSEPLTDQAVLNAIVAALLIREGGTVSLSRDEWEQAVVHQGSLYIVRKTMDDPMVVSLLRDPGDRLDA